MSVEHIVLIIVKKMIGLFKVLYKRTREEHNPCPRPAQRLKRTVRVERDIESPPVDKDKNTLKYKINRLCRLYCKGSTSKNEIACQGSPVGRPINSC